MLRLIVLAAAFANVNCEPETVRENFDYLSYGNNDDFLKNLDLHMVSQLLRGTTHLSRNDQILGTVYFLLQPRDEVVLRPQEVKDWPQQSLNVGQITAVSINSLGQPVIFHRAERIWDER